MPPALLSRHCPEIGVDHVEGVWTFIIPERMVGGDSVYFLEGTYSTNGDAVRLLIDANVFNPEGLLSGVWGDRALQFQVTFSGRRAGDFITDEVERAGIPRTFSVTLTRRADIP